VRRCRNQGNVRPRKAALVAGFTDISEHITAFFAGIRSTEANSTESSRWIGDLE